MATDRRAVTAHLDPELYEEVDDLAEEAEQYDSKSDVARDLIERGIEDRHWTRHLAPIFKEATYVSTAFAFLVPVLMLFFDHSFEDAFLVAMVFTMMAVAAALLALRFAEDSDEVFG